MFKIGEFSKLVRVSARMLRYYEQNGLLIPAETDCFTGYRLYSSYQMPLLARITELRDMGFGVEEIKTLLPHYNNPSIMKEALKSKSRELRAVIAVEQDKLDKIVAKCGILEREFIMSNVIHEVEIKALPAVKVLALREKISAYNAEGVLWEKLGKFVGENKIVCEKHGYSIYHDPEYKESDVDVEIAIPVKEFGESKSGFVYRELEAIPEAATVRFSGSYAGYGAAIQKLAEWVEKNNYEMSGTIRGLAIKSHPDVESEDDMLTEIQVPVKKL